MKKIEPNLPQFIYYTIINNNLKRKKLNSFYFIFQNDFFSNVFKVSNVEIEKDDKTKEKHCFYSFEEVQDLDHECVEFQKDHVRISRWFKFNPDYSFQENIKLIIDGNEEIEMTTRNEVLEKIKIKRL